jgi:hypothetical protein
MLHNLLVAERNGIDRDNYVQAAMAGLTEFQCMVINK